LDFQNVKTSRTLGGVTATSHKNRGPLKRAWFHC